ncbi:5525_t:CDS:2, partial [Entrophospora sp. SA101]
LYNRRILYLDVFELEWIPSTIIKIESLGLPRISQLQPQLIKLLEVLEDLVTIDFESINMIIGSCDLFDTKSRETLEGDAGVNHMVPLTKLIRNHLKITFGEYNSAAVKFRHDLGCPLQMGGRNSKMDLVGIYQGYEFLSHENSFDHKDTTKKTRKDLLKLATYARDGSFLIWQDAHKDVQTSFDKILQYLVEIRTWGIHLLGQMEGHQGLHIKVFGMRQAKCGLFLLSKLDSFPLPNEESLIDFRCITKPIETMIRLASGIKESTKHLQELHQVISKIRHGEPMGVSKKQEYIQP